MTCQNAVYLGFLSLVKFHACRHNPFSPQMLVHLCPLQKLMSGNDTNLTRILVNCKVLGSVAVVGISSICVGVPQRLPLSDCFSFYG